MSRLSNREKILTEGLRVVHERGFSNASVRDITTAANVPNGSFTNHFASKEAFGLEILDLSFEETAKIIDQTLSNPALTPTARLLAYIDANISSLEAHGVENGCLIGNFGVEIGMHSEIIRLRVVEIFKEVQRQIALCLSDAAQAGELSKDIDLTDMASFIVASLQGATILAKADRSVLPMTRFRRTLVATILR
ncbi:MULTISPECIES: TetR family transcriptional regulator C-terminal domain-containing protein [unclassified Pseudomonas]|uniref:TetR family transcriptional regulator C-terminal domain-containing protein n=1 Tax=unclassified Pseudomonas TaxID=196821 RepID=UPI002AC8DDD9|nr:MULTISPECIES: TetR family transcriptional regulator C-terminal domain-containing protein [unclassified Pseudomonas]MEB0043317.1 TetR family transcriptional regulator C-terminal domain-containing protein [Pseudomonas sp. MH10]MEB0077492.1 TetR family transcriptional regulator C-terminal domain-containing protein [Pseudomonas sp. MH10out]MEB0102601.1 TetR family transcriptional regulator C-terminal domain-containing protein [Pseudomonas sp. CCI3.2]MEB0119384.1 TetR family transcriptional regul